MGLVLANIEKNFKKHLHKCILHAYLCVRFPKEVSAKRKTLIKADQLHVKFSTIKCEFFVKKNLLKNLLKRVEA